MGAPTKRERLFFVADADTSDYFTAYNQPAKKKARGWGLDLAKCDVTGWATPAARDWKDTPGMATRSIPDGSIRDRTDQFARQAFLVRSISGATSTSPISTTAPAGALNPAFPLAHGIPTRVGRLRAYGNAIVPQVAAEFIAAWLETQP